MTKQELTTLLRSVGVNENTITAMENAYDMGVEYARARIIEANILEEREACAKLVEVDNTLEDWEIICGEEGRHLLNAMAEAIRARRDEVTYGEPTSRGEA